MPVALVAANGYRRKVRLHVSLDLLKGAPNRPDETPLDQEGLDLSEAIMDAWINFAVHGDPSGEATMGRDTLSTRMRAWPR